MSRIIEFPPDGTMIPFDHEVEQRASAIVMVSLGALGALAQFTVVIATLRQGIQYAESLDLFLLTMNGIFFPLYKRNRQPNCRNNLYAVSLLC